MPFVIELNKQYVNNIRESEEVITKGEQEIVVKVMLYDLVNTFEEAEKYEPSKDISVALAKLRRQEKGKKFVIASR